MNVESRVRSESGVGVAGELLPHAVTAALRLAGVQHTQVTLHHGGTPEAVVTVTVGRSAFYLHTRAAAEGVGAIWQSARTEALQLPARHAVREGALAPPDVAYPSLVVHTAGRPAGVVRLGRNAGQPSYLHVQLGEVIFLMYDKRAFTSCANAFVRAALLGVENLPAMDPQLMRVQRRQPTVSGQAVDRAAAFLGLSSHPAKRASATLRPGRGATSPSQPSTRTQSDGGVPSPAQRKTPRQPRRTR